MIIVSYFFTEQKPLSSRHRKQQLYQLTAQYIKLNVQYVVQETAFIFISVFLI